MTCSYRVAADTWLGLARSAPGAPMVPRQRHLVDQQAAARAERAARAASGLGQDHYSVSRSHTQGMGAAVVAPADARLGVDLGSIARVRDRHATAILNPTEWTALEPHARIRPALGWGLKEAAAKASGEPLRHFPDGLLIEAEADVVRVRVADQPELCFLARWIRFGDLLCVWVRQAG